MPKEVTHAAKSTHIEAWHTKRSQPVRFWTPVVLNCCGFGVVSSPKGRVDPYSASQLCTYNYKYLSKAPAFAIVVRSLIAYLHKKSAAVPDLYSSAMRLHLLHCHSSIPTFFMPDTCKRT